jgi:hypothetical protein
MARDYLDVYDALLAREGAEKAGDARVHELSRHG